MDPQEATELRARYEAQRRWHTDTWRANDPLYPTWVDQDDKARKEPAAPPTEPTACPTPPPSP